MERAFLGLEITKVDAEQRIVEGWAITGEPDLQKDVIPYETASTAFAKFGDSVGIREMHQPKAIGVLKRWWGDAVNKRIGVQVYLSKSRDGEDALTKCKEGVLRGFSIGGKALDWSYDVVKGVSCRVVKALMLTEISLVDVPANPQCVISVVKALGMEKQTHEENTMSEIRKTEIGPMLGNVRASLSSAIRQLGDSNPTLSSVLSQAKSALDAATSSVNTTSKDPTVPGPNTPDAAVRTMKGAGVAIHVKPDDTETDDKEVAPPMFGKPKGEGPPFGRSKEVAAPKLGELEEEEEVEEPVVGIPPVAKESAEMSPPSPPMGAGADGEKPDLVAAIMAALEALPAKIAACMKDASTPTQTETIPTIEAAEGVGSTASVPSATPSATTSATAPTITAASAPTMPAAKPSFLKSMTPAGDIPQREAKTADPVITALMEGDTRKAITEAGGYERLLERADSAIKKSLQEVGISAKRYWVMEPSADAQNYKGEPN